MFVAAVAAAHSPKVTVKQPDVKTVYSTLPEGNLISGGSPLFEVGSPEYEARMKQIDERRSKLGLEPLACTDPTRVQKKAWKSLPARWAQAVRRFPQKPFGDVGDQFVRLDVVGLEVSRPAEPEV